MVFGWLLRANKATQNTRYNNKNEYKGVCKDEWEVVLSPNSMDSNDNNGNNGVYIESNACIDTETKLIKDSYANTLKSNKNGTELACDNNTIICGMQKIHNNEYFNDKINETTKLKGNKLNNDKNIHNECDWINNLTYKQKIFNHDSREKHVKKNCKLKINKENKKKFCNIYIVFISKINKIYIHKYIYKNSLVVKKKRNRRKRKTKNQRPIIDA